MDNLKTGLEIQKLKHSIKEMKKEIITLKENQWAHYNNPSFNIGDIVKFCGELDIYNDSDILKRNERYKVIGIDVQKGDKKSIDYEYKYTLLGNKTQEQIKIYECDLVSNNKNINEKEEYLMWPEEIDNNLCIFINDLKIFEIKPSDGKMCLLNENDKFARYYEKWMLQGQRIITRRETLNSIKDPYPKGRDYWLYKKKISNVDNSPSFAVCLVEATYMSIKLDGYLFNFSTLEKMDDCYYDPNINEYIKE